MPMTWRDPWFSITTTTMWSGVGTPLDDARPDGARPDGARPEDAGPEDARPEDARLVADGPDKAFVVPPSDCQ